MTYDQWKTTDPREYEREEEEQPSELDLAYEEIRRLRARLAAPPQRPADALRLLANLFSESAHQTWTRGEIVNVIEDAITLGSSPARPDYCTASGEAYCKSVAGRMRCSRCPLTRPESGGGDVKNR